MNTIDSFLNIYMLFYYLSTHLFFLISYLYSVELNSIRYDIRYFDKYCEYLLCLDNDILIYNSILMESS